MGQVHAFLAGAFQRSDRDGSLGEDPATAMATAVLGALADAGVEADAVQALGCVEPLSWSYEDLGGTVAETAALSPEVEQLWVPAGGTSPQDLLHQIVPRMMAGELDCAVICGAESMRTRRRAARGDHELPWPQRPLDANPLRGQKPFSSDLEQAHGLVAPIQVFPLFENALATRHGRSAAAQRTFAAELLAANARIAAHNPHAWFQDAPSAEAIAAVSADNRMIVYPYTKRMNAIMDVDQCAALVLLSADFAEARTSSSASAVVLGGAGAEEVWNPLERTDLSSCPAMAVAIRTALERAGLEATDLDAMDLYSCFPSAIELALDVLALPPDRPLSLTGGLAFAGGPGNAYVLHSLAAALERLRATPRERLLITGIGMANTKHAATVLGGSEAVPERATGETTYRESVDFPAAQVVSEPEGAAAIHSWTIEYDRDGNAVKVLLILDLVEGGRTIANVADPPAGARVLLGSDPIGRVGQVHRDPATGRNLLAFD